MSGISHTPQTKPPRIPTKWTTRHSDISDTSDTQLAQTTTHSDFFNISTSKAQWSLGMSGISHTPQTHGKERFPTFPTTQKHHCRKPRHIPTFSTFRLLSLNGGQKSQTCPAIHKLMVGSAFPHFRQFRNTIFENHDTFRLFQHFGF